MYMYTEHVILIKVVFLLLCYYAALLLEGCIMHCTLSARLFVRPFHSVRTCDSQLTQGKCC